MKRIGFKMTLYPGNIDEYKRRHDNIWPELTSLLKKAGISDYSIYLDEKANILFATLLSEDQQALDALPESDIMQRWWQYMSDIMETEDNSHKPMVEELPLMFHLK